MAVHLQEGIKMQCKQMCAFHEVFIGGKLLCFQHGNRSYFLLGFSG